MRVEFRDYSFGRVISRPLRLQERTNTLDPLSVAEQYFDAWNHRDADSIQAAFAEGGIYTDPVSGELIGPEIAGYARALFEAFPDLSFEIVNAAETGNASVSAEWTMRGTNRGPLRGAPPTGKVIELPGADFITVDGDKVRAVHGYFDSGAIPKQLGMQVIVQPASVGPVRLGTCAYLDGGNAAMAGAISVTVLQVREDAEKEEVSTYSRQIMGDLAHTPGFISLLAAQAGDRMVTVTAWEDEEAPRVLLREGSHREAMARFFGEGFTRGGVTSVLTPGRINTYWARCEKCGKMADSRKLDGNCACGAKLPALQYW